MVKRYHKVFRKPQKCKKRGCKTRVMEAWNDLDYCPPCWQMAKTLLRAEMLVLSGFVSKYSARNDFGSGMPENRSYSSDPWKYHGDPA